MKLCEVCGQPATLDKRCDKHQNNEPIKPLDDYSPNRIQDRMDYEDVYGYQSYDRGTTPSIPRRRRD